MHGYGAIYQAGLGGESIVLRGWQWLVFEFLADISRELPQCLDLILHPISSDTSHVLCILP